VNKYKKEREVGCIDDNRKYKSRELKRNMKNYELQFWLSERLPTLRIENFGVQSLN
jgi:hypothetical protein